VVSAAYGIFYEPLLHRRGRAAAGSSQRSSLPQDAANKFPRQLICQSVLCAESLQPGFPEPMTLLVVARNLHLPYAQDWNLNIQRSFGEDWLFQIGYVGTTGVRLPRFIEGNPPSSFRAWTPQPAVRRQIRVRFPPKTT
jgi:hypothetical protein